VVHVTPGWCCAIVQDRKPSAPPRSTIVLNREKSTASLQLLWANLDEELLGLQLGSPVGLDRPRGIALAQHEGAALVADHDVGPSVAADVARDDLRADAGAVVEEARLEARLAGRRPAQQERVHDRRHRAAVGIALGSV